LTYNIIVFTKRRREKWRIKVVVAVSVAEGPKRCFQQSVQTAKRNAKFLSNPVKTALSIAGIVSRSGRIAAVRRVLPPKQIQFKSIRTISD